MDAIPMLAAALVGAGAAWLYFRSGRAVLGERIESRDRRIQEMDERLKSGQTRIEALQISEAALDATLEQERRRPRRNWRCSNRRKRRATSASQ